MTLLPFEAPLPWLWSCHHCHARYPLGATRRCLHDGHYFCGGTTVSALTGKTIKRHKACGSEFDYVGWEDVSRWQRRILDPKLDIGERLKRQDSCEYSCEYPSACHHRGGKILYRKKPSVENDESCATSRTNVHKLNSQSFVDPSCLEMDSTPRPLRTAENTTLAAFPNPKSTGSLLKKMIKSARRNSRETILSSTAGEENAIRCTRSPSLNPLSSSPPTVFTVSEPVGAMASVSELGLVIPSLELSTDLPSFFSPDSSSSSSDEAFSDETFSETASMETHSDEEDEEADYPEKLALDQSNTRGLDHISRVPDIDMTDSIPNSPTSPTSPAPPSIFKGSDALNAVGRLLTPKSPDSSTNPFFIPMDEEEDEGRQTSSLSPPFPRRGSNDEEINADKEGGEAEIDVLENTLSTGVRDKTTEILGLGLNM